MFPRAAVRDLGLRPIRLPRQGYSLILHRKTKTTRDDIRRHVNQRSTECECSRAKHQKSFLGWDTELNLHYAGGLVHLDLIGRARIGVIVEQVVAGSVDVQKGQGGRVGGKQRCTQLTILKRPGLAAVDIEHTYIYCPNSQGKCEDRTNAYGSRALDECGPAFDRDVVGGA